MKQILLLIILCAFSTKFYGQKVTTTKVKFENIDTLVYTDVDVRASFKKGEAGWRKFLVQNLNSMVLVDAGAPSGTYTVLVTFIVRADGKVANHRCDNAPGYGICEEEIRIIKKFKKWVPAQVNGKNVSSYFTQPISFLLDAG